MKIWEFKCVPITLAALLILSGCAETTDTFKQAEKVCAPFGGLKYHYLFPWEEVACNDGTVIKNVGGAEEEK